MSCFRVLVLVGVLLSASILILSSPPTLKANLADGVVDHTINPLVGDGYVFGGMTVMSASDLSSDGIDDLLITSVHQTSFRSRVDFFYGNNVFEGTIVETIHSPADFHIYGITLDHADVNGDNYIDLFVTDYDYSSTTPNKVHLYYGGETFDATPDLSYVGEVIGDSFGTNLVSSDFNNDGYIDLLVTASHSDTGGQNTGRAYLYFGSETMDAVADVTFVGEAAHFFFGHAASSLGDVNGDGYEDLMISAVTYDSSKGRAYLYFGGETVNNVADVVFTGENNDDLLGDSMTGIGDINGDGYDDFMISVGSFDGSGSDIGRVNLYYGGETIDTIPDKIFDGENDGENFGSEVQAMGDINGDGYVDIGIWVPGYSSNKGKVNIYFGGTDVSDTPNITLQGEVSGDTFGGNFTNENTKNSSYASGDINGDGYSDVIIGNPKYPGGAQLGRTLIYLTPPGSPSLSINESYYSNSTLEVGGMATNTGVSVKGVEWSTSNDLPRIWNECSSIDGSFDSDSEEFTCNLAGRDQSATRIYFRTYDANNVYMLQALFETFSIELDGEIPLGIIAVNDGAEETKNTDVELTIDATDATTSVMSMMVSNAIDFSNAVWEDYVVERDWILSDGEGEKTVYIRFKDEVGNISDIFSDSIVYQKLEEVKPRLPSINILPNGKNRGGAIVPSQGNHNNTLNQTVIILEDDSFPHAADLIAETRSRSYIETKNNPDTPSDNNTPYYIDKSNYWQLGDIQEVWLKTFEERDLDPVNITAESQDKPAIIALSYTTDQLSRPGAGTFPETSLKLTHSYNGVDWEILPSSTIDMFNKTVAAIHKVGGYYMIVMSMSPTTTNFSTSATTNGQLSYSPTPTTKQITYVEDGITTEEDITRQVETTTSEQLELGGYVANQPNNVIDNLPAWVGLVSR